MRNPRRESCFRFKQFAVRDSVSAMKVGTDGVLLGAWAPVDGVSTVLDVGTGTGLIALMIAQRCGNAVVDAVEIDPDAAAEAESNCALSPWADRITVFNSDFSEMVATSGRCWDMIVSNPPFFSNGETSADSRRAGARHESSLSYSILLQCARGSLISGGSLCFISPADREDDIMYRSALCRMYPAEIVRVATVEGKSPSRILWRFTDKDVPVEESVMAIRDASGHYTERYVKLTENFYLNM